MKALTNDLSPLENGKPILVDMVETKKCPSPPGEHNFQIKATSSVHVGPLPAPEAFEKYETTLPGAAERILKLAEGEALHRRAMENKIVTHNIRSGYSGQLCAFALGTMGLCGGVYCVIQGHPIAGSIIAGSGLASLIAPFLRDRSSSKK